MKGDGVLSAASGGQRLLAIDAGLLQGLIEWDGGDHDTRGG